jgi:hypothetical protein
VVERTHEHPPIHWQHNRRNLGCAGFFCLLVLSMICRPHREQARSHRDLGRLQDWRQPPLHCGSEPARDGGGSACIDAECAGPFASKPAPTGGLGFKHKIEEHHRSTVGASLLAMVVGQLASMLNVPAHSRASPLPQGDWVLNTKSKHTTDPLWERACSRWRWVRRR